MKKSKYSESQIVATLKEGDAGMMVKTVKGDRFIYPVWS